MYENDRLSPERLFVLQNGWVGLLGRFGVPPEKAYPLHDRLLAAYAEPHRHYHTLEHVAEVLKIVGKLGAALPELPAVQLAVWYHDAVYDPKAKDNEEQSAEMAATELAGAGVDAQSIETVRQLILATRHLARAPEGAATDLLIDADLAILGSEEARYRRYAEAIRREYAFVLEGDYRRGRAAVLQSFLDREFIYRTPAFRTIGEGPARQNLRTEIASLNANLTPA